LAGIDLADGFAFGCGNRTLQLTKFVNFCVATGLLPRSPRRSSVSTTAIGILARQNTVGGKAADLGRRHAIIGGAKREPSSFGPLTMQIGNISSKTNWFRLGRYRKFQ
jgi:hypothetical protein